jgi:hypothetical protein
MFRTWIIVLCAAALPAASPARAEPKKKFAPEPATFSSRKDNKDGSSALTFGTRLPAPVETKVGVDLGIAGTPDFAVDPEKLLDKPADHNGGAGWASVMAPATPFGFTKAKVDARLDPGQDQGNMGMAVSRPLGESLLLTLQNSYAITRTGIPFTPSTTTHSLETGHVVRFDVLTTHTAISAGTKSSTLDDRDLRTLSAEQKIAGPLTVTGTISETPTGAFDRVLKAGFRTTW